MNISSTTTNDDTQRVLATVHEHVTSVIGILRTIAELWKGIDTHAASGEKTLNWKEYRLYDTIEVCTQEAERIANSIHGIPGKELLGRESLMLLEQRYGLWQPYISDDSDDEDWTQETRSCHETDEDEIQSESEEDIEFIE